jgi:hypothetical protein
MNWKDPQVIWLALLMIALIAHMIKDATEFRKIRRLEQDVAALKK